MRRLWMALAVVFAIVAAPRSAYAIVIGPLQYDLTNKQWFVGSHDDAFSAAAELAGFDLSDLTTEQRNALLDDTGDYVAFWELAEDLVNLSQNAVDMWSLPDAVRGLYDIMGLDTIWFYRSPDDRYIDEAAQDIADCINEHPRVTGNPDVGGGGGSDGDDDTIDINGNTYDVVNLGSINGNIYNLVYFLDDSVLSFDASNVLAANPVPSGYNVAVLANGSNATSGCGFSVMYLQDGLKICVPHGASPNRNNTWVINPTTETKDCTAYYSIGWKRDNGIFSFDKGNVSSNTEHLSANSLKGLSTFANNEAFSLCTVGLSGGTGSPTYTPTLPQYPDNDIPDPTNITLPNITLPNITLPNLNPPSTQPSNPTYNTYTYNTYNTATGEDVIPYLRNIIEWLSEIDLDIVSGLNALGDIMDGVNTQIRQQVKWLFDSLDVELDAGVTAINTTMRTLVDSLAGLINDAFEDSFYDLKVWLKDALTKIKNEVSDFDDDMLYQLKLIRRKMGGGRSSEPSPKDEPDDWLKWWSDLISKLLEKLADALPDELLELVEDFKALSSKFPFSIPWDIAFLVGLFAHAPVTPVFDYPVPYGYQNGVLLVASVHVDMSPWDNVALAIRNTQLVGFAIWLAFNTSKLSTYLKLPGSGTKGE